MNHVENEDSGKLEYVRVPLRAQHNASFESPPHDREKVEPASLSYVRPIYGGSLKGAYKLPRSAIAALGNGDHEAGLATSDKLFGHHTALGRGIIHPMVMEIIVGCANARNGCADIRKSRKR